MANGNESYGASVKDLKLHRRRQRIWLYMTAGVLLFVVLFPFLWMFQMSFRPMEDIFGFSFNFKPTLENYRALRTGNFPRSFWNSVAASISSTLLSLIIGVPAAYSLSRARFQMQNKIALWILSTRMAPPIAFTIPFFLAYRHLHLQDTILGLVLIYLTFNLALVIWMMQTYFDAIPQTLEEAAWVDGCSVWGTFLRITLPLTAPGLAATAVLCFIYSWNDFFFALILTRTKAMTAPVAIVNFMQYEGWEWGKIAAGGTLVMLPVVIFSFLVRHYLIRGLIAGSVKE
ncbi:MAG: carbohydrate ABC transporter permease [Deltaproteobacteria bacterium]|nr:carbohydrate ABC transporter permease [Deltaproteobacteria bacterium]MBW1994929.1 carbohydrate ABC transporter permease [Deltaproteobacteria bacterium]MBW2154192.1 carbohydrate ABC transporter permease [Deltaproteobacteria bacterium]